MCDIDIRGRCVKWESANLQLGQWVRLFTVSTQLKAKDTNRLQMLFQVFARHYFCATMVWALHQLIFTTFKVVLEITHTNRER